MSTMIRIARLSLAGLAFFALAASAMGTTRYVANDGVDGASCGTVAAPCRSITQGIAVAVAGDTVMVGPGLYTRDSGETGSPGCSCMLSVNKRVILLSSDGAAATVLDAATAQVDQSVLIIADGAEFGRPDHGFMVLPVAVEGTGIFIDSANIKVRGNQVIAFNNVLSGFNGIMTLDANQTILIEGNQVIGWWGVGIHIQGPGKTVNKNHTSMNGGLFGIRSAGIVSIDGNTVITGNIAINNAVAGIQVFDASSVVGNSVHGNGSVGILNSGFSAGIYERNNIYGNRACGLSNGVKGVTATGNYWGAPSGPGSDPADSVCNFNFGTTITSPFATKRYSIDPTVEP